MTTVHISFSYDEGVGSAPAAVNCPSLDPLAPIASAGMDLTVFTGTLVTLTGSTKNDIPCKCQLQRFAMFLYIRLAADGLSFLWAQISGPTISLSSTTNATTTFNAPSVSALTTVMFRLVVSNSHGSSSDTVMITVNPSQIDHVSSRTPFPSDLLES